MKNLDILIDEFSIPCFETKKNERIKCAFNSNSNYSPICAACDERNTRYFCQRNGTDNEFQIGYVND